MSDEGIVSRLNGFLGHFGNANENEREAAVNAFVTSVRRLDPRDLRITFVNGSADALDKDIVVREQRIAEYEKLMKMAYPTQHKLMEDNRALLTQIAELKAKLREKPIRATQDKLDEAKKAQSEARKEAKKEVARLTKMTNEKIQNNFAFRLLRAAVEELGGNSDRGVMGREEMYRLLDVVDPKVSGDTALAALGYEEPPDTPLPWFRIALRAASRKK